MLLERAISSVLRQSLPVKELIVVDDGSVDGTHELLSRMASRDDRIRVLSQQRGGANRARNAGAHLAVSDWIAFLDSDDVWEEDKLMLQLCALNEHPSAVASFTGLRRIGHDAGKVFLPPSSPSLLDLRAANVLSTTSSAVVKSSVFREVGGFDADLPSCQDWDLWFRLRLKGEFAVIRQPLVIYDAGPHARISSDLSKVIDGHNIVFKRVLQGVSEDDPNHTYILARHKLVLGEMYLRNGELLAAFTQVLASFRSRPSKWGLRLLAVAISGFISNWASGSPKQLQA
jgi:glycosyltransferase involved in cell wall biosynthesis